MRINDKRAVAAAAQAILCLFAAHAFAGGAVVAPAAASAATATAAEAPAAPPQPVAAVEPVEEDYFGTLVSDDYRWMEDRRAPRFVAWAKAEDAHARGVLARIPGRDALLARVSAHTGAGVAVSGVRVAGGRVFYGRRAGDDGTAKLYVRDGDDGPERLLVDPDRFAHDGEHAALDYYQPSPDGRFVAYAISTGGSEQSVIRVRDVATGGDGAEAIDRTEDGHPAWLPDGAGFFYNRFAAVAPDAKETERYLHSRAMLHLLGTDVRTDMAVAGTGVTGSPAMSPVDEPVVATSAASPWAVLLVYHGSAPAASVYVAPSADLRRGEVHWRAVAQSADEVTDAVPHGDRLYLLSTHGAPHGQVLALDARAGALAQARVVVPTGPRVVERLVAASDALYVVDLDAGVERVRRLGHGDAAPAEVVLPVAGTVDVATADPRAPGLLFDVEGWVAAPRFFRTRGGAATPLALAPPPLPGEFGDIEAEELTATAADGTSIPLSIVHRKGLKPDGSHLAYLTGYGAYGIALKPHPVSRWVPLLEDGGVYAVAHVRGGGEFGEDWHRAGFQATKPNTYRDLIACAQALVARGWTRPGRLAIEGASAGGITAGMALAERPDLFRVAFIDVGDANPLRSEYGTDGAANAAEYGSAANEAGFRALLAVDATQHVRKGVPYPAVMLSAGMNDPRVAPWQPGKMAAKLQAATASGRPVLLRVDFDAGHGIGSTRAQRDGLTADQLAFLYWQADVPGYQPSP